MLTARCTCPGSGPLSRLPAAQAAALEAQKTLAMMGRAAFATRLHTEPRSPRKYPAECYCGGARYLEIRPMHHNAVPCSRRVARVSARPDQAHPVAGYAAMR